MSRRHRNQWLLDTFADQFLPPRDNPVFFIALATPHAASTLDRKYPYQHADVLDGPNRLAGARIWQQGQVCALYGTAPDVAAAVEAAGRADLIVLSATAGSALAVQMVVTETPNAADVPGAIIDYPGVWRRRHDRWMKLVEIAAAVETARAA